MTDLSDTDFTQRFIFDDSDTRGELVALERSYAEVLAKHPYPEPVAQLLGELMAAASLLVGTLKFDGLLILQARSDGPIPLLMIECSSEREIRGLARYDADRIAPDATLADLMPNGVLALTVDPTLGQRYQASSTSTAKPCPSALPTISSCRSKSARVSGCTPMAVAPVACCCSNCPPTA